MTQVYTWRDMARVLEPGIRVVLKKVITRGMHEYIPPGTVLVVKENGLNEIWCAALMHMEHDLLDEVVVCGPYLEEQWDLPCEVFQIARSTV